MQKCPRFDACSAPICPMDGAKYLRNHLKGEPICFYIRQYVKNEPPKDEIESRIYENIQKHWNLILEIGKADFRKKIKRASQQPSKRDTKNLKNNGVLTEIKTK